MKTPWPNIVDEAQGYLSAGVTLHPHVNEQLLEALDLRERLHKDLCLVPLARFELYHIRLERKVRTRIQYQRAA